MKTRCSKYKSRSKNYSIEELSKINFEMADKIDFLAKQIKELKEAIEIKCETDCFYCIDGKKEQKICKYDFWCPLLEYSRVKLEKKGDEK